MTLTVKLNQCHDLLYKLEQRFSNSQENVNFIKATNVDCQLSISSSQSRNGSASPPTSVPFTQEEIKRNIT